MRVRERTGRGWLRAAWALLAVVVALAWSGSARAQGASKTRDDDIEMSPRDVPIVVQPSAIVIPPLPETDQVRDLGWLRVAYPPSAHERVQPLLDTPTT